MVTAFGRSDIILLFLISLLEFLIKGLNLVNIVPAVNGFKGRGAEYISDARRRLKRVNAPRPALSRRKVPGGSGEALLAAARRLGSLCLRFSAEWI